MLMNNTPSGNSFGILIGEDLAPGINALIASVVTEANNHRIEVIGIPDGFQQLVRGDISRCRHLRSEEVDPVSLRGGSILRTSRTSATKSEVDMRNVLDCLGRLGITRLVTVGSEGTALD